MRRRRQGDADLCRLLADMAPIPSRRAVIYHARLPESSVRMTIQAPVAAVWRACTSEEDIARWYSPVSGDFQLGGTVSVSEFANCELLACDSPRSFRGTWFHPGRP